MTDYKDLHNNQKAALHIVNDKDWSYSDEEYYDNYINGYHCDEERRQMGKEEDKLMKLAYRINALKKFDLI